MANYATLKAAIAASIKENGNNEITGALLQQVLLSMVNSLGIGYTYMGIATPATNPGTPDQNVFYLASTAGTYTNFGGLVLADGEIAILKYNGAWSKDSTGAATQESVNQLGQQVIYDVSANNDGATFASLSALLSSENLSTLIPIAVRCGGMSIRFAQTSDNKYVQYRLMSHSFNTTPANWQGVDDEPTAGSKNLVESGGVINSIDLSNNYPYITSLSSHRFAHFIKEMWIDDSGSVIDTTKQYEINAIARNHTTFHYLICIREVETENYILTQYKDLSTQDEDKIYFVKNKGITFYFLVDWTCLNDGELVTSGNISLKLSIDDCLNKDNSPSISSYLNKNEIESVSDEIESVSDECENIKNSIFSHVTEKKYNPNYTELTYISGAVDKPLIRKVFEYDVSIRKIKGQAGSSGTLYCYAIDSTTLKVINKYNLGTVSADTPFEKDVNIVIPTGCYIAFNGVSINFSVTSPGSGYEFSGLNSTIYNIGDTVTLSYEQTFAYVVRLSFDFERTESNFQEKLVSGENIKTINGINVLGSGNIDTNVPYTKLAAIGDSTSYGAGSTGGQTSWVNYLAQKMNIALQKKATNGATIGENQGLTYFYQMCQNIDSDVDLITVQLGVNDVSFIDAEQETLGDITEVLSMTNSSPTNKEQSTLYNNSVLGKYRWCLEYLKLNHPNAKIVVFTPFYFANSGVTTQKIRDCEKYIANFLNIPVISITDINAYNNSSFGNDFFADTVHPNDLGYKTIAGFAYQHILELQK